LACLYYAINKPERYYIDSHRPLELPAIRKGGKEVYVELSLSCPDFPPNMFVTCLAALLDSRTGRLQYANAGHDLPYLRHADGVSELRATGMPLGLMPNMSYEQKEIALKPGESVLLYSDGLVEAHDPQREMFGFPRMQEFVGVHPGGASLIDFLLAELAQFTGEEWDQEDDIALLTLQRLRS
jgi:serine phosphatase RsbU (regulator of sigma subunit)